MAPNPKAKKDLQKLKINKDQPAVRMIETDSPIVDSPVAIDGEWHPEGPSQDVRVFTFASTPSPHQRYHRVNVFSFPGSDRTPPV